MAEYHTPVLLKETISILNPEPGGIFIDGTLGGGGHTEEIAKKVGPKGLVLGLDKDDQAIAYSKKRLKNFKNVILVKSSFANMAEVAKKLTLPKVNGVLLDLGVSSRQLDAPKRGFSFDNPSAPLDMRMDLSVQQSAADIVNKYSQTNLFRVIKELGEERYAGSISKEIVKQREKRPIKTSGDLLEIIKRATPPDYRFKKPGNSFASKVFRAIRMEVNNELEELSKGLAAGLLVLSQGGIMAVITFHSLEDNLVKRFFREKSAPKEAGYNQDGSPKYLPGEVKLLTREAIKPQPEELASNPRARSSQLRAVVKL